MEEGVQLGNITIPLIKGEKGDTGDSGKISSLTVTMLDSTASPTVTNTGTVYDAKYVLGIPRGTAISDAVINESNELVLTLGDGTEFNLGVVVGTSISNIAISEDFDFVITLSDGSEIVAGNLETELQNILSDYYTKDDVDAEFENWADDVKDNFGHSLSLSLNPTTYVLTIGLVDYNGTTLDTKTVDLPLESVVVSGSYDNVNKKVVLTLQSGSTVEFSVADLVAGLQTEITNANKLSADLVTDTNTTNKFVTASEKTQITTNQTAISNIKDGTSIDSFGDVETAFTNYYDKTAIDNIVGDLETILETLDTRKWGGLIEYIR